VEDRQRATLIGGTILLALASLIVVYVHPPGKEFAADMHATREQLYKEPQYTM
jgi:hypothetical protein